MALVAFEAFGALGFLAAFGLAIFLVLAAPLAAGFPAGFLAALAGDEVAAGVEVEATGAGVVATGAGVEAALVVLVALGFLC